MNRGGLGDAPAAGAAAAVAGNCVAVAPFAAALAGVGFWPDERPTAASTKRHDSKGTESFIVKRDGVEEAAENVYVPGGGFLVVCRRLITSKSQ